MNINEALSVIKPHLPIFQSELIMQAWQTLEDCCTQPTDVQQLKAEIAAISNLIVESVMLPGIITVDFAKLRDKLRQLSAV